MSVKWNWQSEKLPEHGTECVVYGPPDHSNAPNLRYAVWLGGWVDLFGPSLPPGENWWASASEFNLPDAHQEPGDSLSKGFNFTPIPMSDRES